MPRLLKGDSVVCIHDLIHEPEPIRAGTTGVVRDNAAPEIVVVAFEAGAATVDLAIHESELKLA
ncbi:MAG: hypothetical protein K1X53_12080 [Candidatus Sumerlaeaceae bacterium]|nr:hypothetical protein [Candidatus Sumerlaeaceae bacterium]